jgi:hypothetical protein
MPGGKWMGWDGKASFETLWGEREDAVQQACRMTRECMRMEAIHRIRVQLAIAKGRQKLTACYDKNYRQIYQYSLKSPTAQLFLAHTF